MGVVWHTPESERAAKHADNGDYETAYSLAARSAQSRFQRFGLTSLGSNGNMAVGDLLFAICYARNAGAEDTAVRLRGTLGGYTGVISECAHQRHREEWPSMTWACLVGVCEELIGDAHLLTCDETASRCYDRAASWYRLEECREAHLDRNSPAPCWQWGMKPEFDKAWAAFEEYVEWLDTDEVEPLDTIDLEVYTFERLAYKRQLLSAVVE